MTARLDLASGRAVIGRRFISPPAALRGVACGRRHIHGAFLMMGGDRISETTKAVGSHFVAVFPNRRPTHPAHRTDTSRGHATRVVPSPRNAKNNTPEHSEVLWRCVLTGLSAGFTVAPILRDQNATDDIHSTITIRIILFMLRNAMPRHGSVLHACTSTLLEPSPTPVEYQRRTPAGST
jgi:hypothetical protein